MELERHALRRRRLLPTGEAAIQAAIEDAGVSVSASGLYNCALVGEPQVFPRPNDPFERLLNAQVTISCT